MSVKEDEALGWRPKDESGAMSEEESDWCSRHDSSYPAILEGSAVASNPDALKKFQSEAHDETTREIDIIEDHRESFNNAAYTGVQCSNQKPFLQDQFVGSDDVEDVETQSKFKWIKNISKEVTETECDKTSFQAVATAPSDQVDKVWSPKRRAHEATANLAVWLQKGADPRTQVHVLLHFLFMSILLSINHGALVSCLAFATLRLGFVGAWQASLFHLAYAVSSFCGVATIRSPRNSIIVGMTGYSIYVACFWFLEESKANESTTRNVLAIVGATCGGIGSAFVWIGQGVYFKRAAHEYVSRSQEEKIVHQPDKINHQETYNRAVSWFSGIFAFVYLLLEVGSKLISWFILRFYPSGDKDSEPNWNIVLCFYTILAVISTMAMGLVNDYPSQDQYDLLGKSATETRWTKMSAAWRLLLTDSKMKYMVVTCAPFGFATALVNAHVNDHVIRHESVDDNTVGLFSALTSAVGALCSLLFAMTLNKSKQKTQKLSSVVLVIGFVAFGLTAMPSLVRPHTVGVPLLLCVYSFQGIGRSTFEGPLRATFANFFEKEEAAFANMTLQSGLFLALGFFLAFGIPCDNSSAYCVEENTAISSTTKHHDILALLILVVLSAVLAVLGYWKALRLFSKEKEESATATRRRIRENLARVRD